MLKITCKKARQAEINELKSLGMSEEEIQSFYGFMKSPDNVTTSNMVKVWKVLNEEERKRRIHLQKRKKKIQPRFSKWKKCKVVLLVEGKSTPAKKPEDKELDGFMKGIMQFSK